MIKVSNKNPRRYNPTNFIFACKIPLIGMRKMTKKIKGKSNIIYMKNNILSMRGVSLSVAHPRKLGALAPRY
jgi:hypothetical protein